MKYFGGVCAILAVTGIPAGAQQPAQQAIFEISEVNRDTVPAGTPEAFEAAFKEKARPENGRWYEVVREINGQTMTFVPLTLLSLSDGRNALISTSTSACATGQACFGVNAIHYLRRERGRYVVEGEWLDVDRSGAMDNPTRRWGWANAIEDAPVLYTEGGMVWQGLSCSYASLTQFTPAGPVKIARIPVHYSNSAAVGAEADHVSYTGRIVSAEKGQTFTVVYSGSSAFSVRYVRGADGRYNPADRAPLPQCKGEMNTRSDAVLPD